ncbi:hypothetical protein [Tsuneonella suprasediminis]|uniref:hypothetical protein n=1 Tax=Tsuneonella suprasediminis TaxID=2306996 RepID=UPI002F9394F6
MLIILGFVLWSSWRTDPVVTEHEGLSFASGELLEALSSSESNLNTRIVERFRDRDSINCAGFVRDDLSGIACNERGGWHLRLQRDGASIATADGEQAKENDLALVRAISEMKRAP